MIMDEVKKKMFLGTSKADVAEAWANNQKVGEFTEVIRLSDLEDVMGKAVCENCGHLDKTRMNTENAIGYCPILKKTITNKKFGCIPDWQSKTN